jgi:hypothetical protein
MSTINALVHHIDQLLTQHRALQHGHAQLQSRVTELEEQLLQQQTANTLTQDPHLESEQAHNQNLEDDLNHLIGLFDQATEARHD